MIHDTVAWHIYSVWWTALFWPLCHLSGSNALISIDKNIVLLSCSFVLACFIGKCIVGTSWESTCDILSTIYSSCGRWSLLRSISCDLSVAVLNEYAIWHVFFGPVVHNIKPISLHCHCHASHASVSMTCASECKPEDIDFSLFWLKYLGSVSLAQGAR